MVYEAARVGQNCEFCGSPARRITRRLNRRFGRKACCRSASIAIACATAFDHGGGANGWRPCRPRGQPSSTRCIARCISWYWTFDAHAHCPWEAEAGHYDDVDVEGRDSKGNRIVRRERRTRWVPAAGVIEHTFDDEAVPGTQGLPLDLLRQVEPFLDAGRRSVRHRVSVGPRGRALQGRADGCRGSLQAQMHARSSSCVPGKCPVTPTATSGSIQRIRVRRSNISWCRFGCSPTRSAGAHTRCWSMDPREDRRQYSYSPWKIALLIL